MVARVKPRSRQGLPSSESNADRRLLHATKVHSPFQKQTRFTRPGKKSVAKFKLKQLDQKTLWRGRLHGGQARDHSDHFDF